MQKCYNPS